MQGHLLALLVYNMTLFSSFVCLFYVSFHYICEDIDIHLLFTNIVKCRQAHKHSNDLFLKAALQRNRSCFI